MDRPAAAAPPVRVVCALIVADSKLLLAQRGPGRALAGLWEFPGGKIEPAESPEAALKREIQEELDCHIQVGQPGPVITWQYPTLTIQLHPYLCQLAAHSPAPIALEHASLQWFTPAELRAATPENLPLAAANQPILRWWLDSFEKPSS
jgi:8-oxo-dGTP diphosphatase